MKKSDIPIDVYANNVYLGKAEEVLYHSEPVVQFHPVDAIAPKNMQTYQWYEFVFPWGRLECDTNAHNIVVQSQYSPVKMEQIIKVKAADPKEFQFYNAKNVKFEFESLSDELNSFEIQWDNLKKAMSKMKTVTWQVKNPKEDIVVDYLSLMYNDHKIKKHQDHVHYNIHFWNQQVHSKFQYFDSYPSATPSGYRRHSEVDKLPGIKEDVLCPACKIEYPEAAGPRSLDRVIIELNDIHRWTREQIADWLETLDIDLRFKDEEHAEH